MSADGDVVCDVSLTQTVGAQVSVEDALREVLKRALFAEVLTEA